MAADASLLLDDGDERGVDIGGEMLGIAADVDVGAFLDPGIDVAGVLAQSVLDIDLVCSIAREGDIHTRQDPLLEEILPFGLVEKIRMEIALAEEQPGFSAGAPGFPFLNEGAIGARRRCRRMRGRNQRIDRAHDVAG